MVERLTRYFIRRANVRRLLLDALWPEIRARLERRSEPDYTPITSDILITKLDTEYVLFRVRVGGFVWGYLDFAELRSGDVFEIRLHQPVGNRELLFEYWVIEGQQDAPGFTFAERFLPPGSRLSVTQKKGISKRVDFTFYRR